MAVSNGGKRKCSEAFSEISISKNPSLLFHPLRNERHHVACTDEVKIIAAQVLEKSKLLENITEDLFLYGQWMDTTLLSLLNNKIHLLYKAGNIAKEVLASDYASAEKIAVLNAYNVYLKEDVFNTSPKPLHQTLM
jgi:hypothetical protein